jgi:hypothetical protein
VPELDFKERRPFHFLGNFGEKQKNTFYKWIDARTERFPKIEEFWRIRAQILRKTGGVLEDFYTEKREGLKPFFQKDVWKPGKNGHFTPLDRIDIEPAEAVEDIKEDFLFQLQLDEEGVFFMDLLRTTVESCEDNAQYAKEAPSRVGKRKSDLDRMFTEDKYANILVRDISAPDQEVRVNAFQQPTDWELKLFSHDTYS